MRKTTCTPISKSSVKDRSIYYSPALARRFFVKGIITRMRRLSILGICLAAIAAIVFALLLFYPASQDYSLNLKLLDGTPARVTAAVQQRGWSGQNLRYSLQVSTEKTNSGDTLQFWAKVELPGTTLDPQGITERVIAPGEETIFTWKAQTGTPGVIPGVLWLYQSQAGAEKQLLYAREFTLATSDFLGLPASSMMVGSSVIFLLGLFFIWYGERKAKPLFGRSKTLVL